MEQLKVFELGTDKGIKMTVTNYGGRIISLYVPDKNGKFEDILLGYDKPEQYLYGNPYFGSLIGPYANRIANGKFALNGKSYQLIQNNNGNCLHGGPIGFHNVVWHVEKLSEQVLSLTYFRPDGQEFFPGNLSVKVIYELTNDNELIIDYKATTDADTVVSLTHHSFFNLLGAGNGSIENHELFINADRFCPVNENTIPTGELKSVKGGAFDFTKIHKIGTHINDVDQQLVYGKGYDHNWVLNKKSDELSLAAKVIESVSGRVMEVFTTEPGLQFYAGNFLNKNEIGKGGKVYDFRTAFCLEAQHFPDSPNQNQFPTTVLKQAEVYLQKTVHKFSVQI
jgi:aldose 1-epimerase